jgi:hypothetical protein
MTLPSARQGSLPAGWLAFAGRELNPLDRNERFQLTCSSPFPGLTLTLHPTLPDPRAAEGLPPHPALRTAGQWQPRRQHRAGARTARRAAPLRTARCLRGPSGRRPPHAATTVPPAAADACSSSRPSRAAASQSTDPRPRRPRSGSTPHDAVIADPAPHRSAPFWPALARQHTACADQQDWPVIAPQILPSNVRSARSRQHARPRFELKRSDRKRRLNFPNTHADAKSP